MHEETRNFGQARTLADLGTPPSDRRLRSAWARRTFVELGCYWYAGVNRDPGRRQEIEDLAVELLRGQADVWPALSTLKSAVANVSFLPSTVDSLWDRAFPPSADDRAHAMEEWALIEKVKTRVDSLVRSGDVSEAEGLRRAAVAFLNKYLESDEVGECLRAKARGDLSKRGRSVEESG